MGIGEHKDIDSAGLPRGWEGSREGDNVYACATFPVLMSCELECFIWKCSTERSRLTGFVDLFSDLSTGGCPCRDAGANGPTRGAVVWHSVEEGLGHGQVEERCVCVGGWLGAVQCGSGRVVQQSSACPLPINIYRQLLQNSSHISPHWQVKAHWWAPYLYSAWDLSVVDTIGPAALIREVVLLQR